MISKFLHRMAAIALASNLALVMPGSLLAGDGNGGGFGNPAESAPTATPIKHVVVIFGENVSFDHYFATYPYAANSTPGEPKFIARDNTPAVDNLLSGGLLTENPNSVQPFRLGRNEAVTCDQNHNYLPEQKAVDHGLVDNYVTATGSGNSTLQTASTLFYGPGPVSPITVGDILQPGQYNKNVVTGGNSTTGPFSYSGYCFDAGNGTTTNNGIVMAYYDGNTVTAMWNYAQHFALSDNSWSTTFGPSAPGAINLVAGTTAGATMVSLRPNGKASSPSGLIWGGQAGATTGALIGDARPAYDDCVNSNGQLFNTNQASLSGRNIGDLLGDLVNPGKGITWGWFMGGFGPTTPYNPPSVPYAVCGSAGTGLAGFGNGPLPDNFTTVGDYIPHHEPFEFYLSTTNPHHLPPTSASTIGKTDQANHQYDLSQFFVALEEGSLPSVSFLKAAAYQDAHPGYSDPLDEQYFVVTTVNAIMASPYWRDTAVIILYDDSDGWYDHTMDPVVNQSGPTAAVTPDLDDALAAADSCGKTATAGPTANIGGLCGYGQRQPLLVISPWAKDNYVDHSITDQSSVIRFIEDNWLGGERIGGASSDSKAGTINNMFDFKRKFPEIPRTLLLDPTTGEEIHIY